MATITILPSLDLAIEDLYVNMNSISVADLSQYADIPDSDDVSLEITAPGYSRINVPFTPGNMNVYHCSDLNITCGATDCCPLPDGIYSLRYTVRVLPSASALTPTNSTIIPVNFISGPFSIEKTFMKVDQIRCRWMNAFLKVDLECECSNSEQKYYKDELYRVERLINGAVAANNSCNVLLATKYYSKANTMLNSISCKFNMPAPVCNPCNCH